MSVDVVVFPVAGLGTRFLPATKSVPKEMLPVLDKPLIQLAVEEAARANVKDVVLVTNGSKRSIEDHFDANFELEHTLSSRGKTAVLKLVTGTLPAGMSVTVVRQKEALGLGHAVLCARKAVGDRPFAVMLPDDFIDDTNPGCLADMVRIHDESGSFSLAVEDVPRDKTDKYGVVSLAPDGRICAMVEKPAPDKAPSTLAVVGRYVLPPEIFAVLEKQAPGAGGEIQLTDGIAALLDRYKFVPHRFKGVRYDCGSKLGYLKANVVLGMKDAEVGQDFGDWVHTL